MVKQKGTQCKENQIKQMAKGKNGKETMKKGKGRKPTNGKGNKW